jgi:hypothetical protein
MLEFKNISRVRCLECKDENFINLIKVGVEKLMRTKGFEYEHIFRGESNCGNCGDNMKILYSLYEYPKDIQNYLDIKEEGCLSMDDNE